MKWIIVVGARPNFMKAAPILNAIRSHNARSRNGSDQIRAVLVHTGQHYDTAMSDAFFADLSLPQPDIFLGVGSGSHAMQTAEIMTHFEEVLLREQPDTVIVVGDVNSTVACALVTAKVSYNAPGDRPLIVHVEAGLRSFDRSMPEECNRVVTDHLSDVLFVSEESGLRNLEKEGIPQNRVFFVGNTMIDTLRTFEEKAETSTILARLGIEAKNNGSGNQRYSKPYVLLTLHRPANVDGPATFLEILEGLRDVATSHRVIFPAHPRTQKQIRHLGFERYFEFAALESAPLDHEGQYGKIMLLEPQGYLDFLCLMKYARLVVTDSGGIQEETTCLGIPCVTVRENTERPVTISAGTNVLGGIQRTSIRDAIRLQLGRTFQKATPDMWDGKAALRIVERLTCPSNSNYLA
jgi:UDP-N-acetylglucosamine 2-epimerase (non-hydrolysing)